MGLAFSAMSQIGKPTFIDNLISHHSLSHNVFAFYLSHSPRNGSELTVGGVNQLRYSGDIVHSPVVSESYWEIQSTGLAVGGTKVSKGVKVAIDTGTTQIYFPKSIAAAVYGAIPGAYRDPTSDATMDYYIFPCSSLPIVSFIFSGSPKQYAIRPADFSLGPWDATGTVCYGDLIGIDIVVGGQPLAILGDQFLKSWYSVYSYDTASGPSVGFARARP